MSTFTKDDVRPVLNDIGLQVAHCLDGLESGDKVKFFNALVCIQDLASLLDGVEEFPTDGEV